MFVTHSLKYLSQWRRLEFKVTTANNVIVYNSRNRHNTEMVRNKELKLDMGAHEGCNRKETPVIA